MGKIIDFQRSEMYRILKRSFIGEVERFDDNLSHEEAHQKVYGIGLKLGESVEKFRQKKIEQLKDNMQKDRDGLPHGVETQEQLDEYRKNNPEKHDLNSRESVMHTIKVIALESNIQELEEIKNASIQEIDEIMQEEVKFHTGEIKVAEGIYDKEIVIAFQDKTDRDRFDNFLGKKEISRTTNKNYGNLGYLDGAVPYISIAETQAIEKLGDTLPGFRKKAGDNYRKYKGGEGDIDMEEDIKKFHQNSIRK